MLISIVAGPKFIEFLRRNEMGQQIREEGPEGHRVKQGTPTMGGLLLVFSAAVAFLALRHYTIAGLAVFGVMLGCGAIGFVDDYIKLRHRRSLGLSGRWKLSCSRRSRSARSRGRGGERAERALRAGRRTGASGSRSACTSSCS